MVKKLLKTILIIIIIIVCTSPIWIRGISYIAPHFPGIMGAITKENMEEVKENQEVQTQYPITFSAENVMYSPINYYCEQMEAHIVDVDAGYSWIDYTYNNGYFDCTIDKLSKEEFKNLSKEKYDYSLENVLSGARAAVRSFGETKGFLISSDGNLYNILYDNRVSKDTVKHPFAENDKEQIEAKGDENPNAVSYFPCFDMGFSSFFVSKAYRNIGFELEHNNTKVTNVMGISGDEDFDKRMIGYFAIVEDDITTVQKPKEFDDCEWLPKEGETHHVKFMIQYMPYLINEIGLSGKGDIGTSYIQVLDYSKLQ